MCVCSGCTDSSSVIQRLVHGRASAAVSRRITGPAAAELPHPSLAYDRVLSLARVLNFLAFCMYKSTNADAEGGGAVASAWHC